MLCKNVKLLYSMFNVSNFNKTLYETAFNLTACDFNLKCEPHNVLFNVCFNNLICDK